MSTRKIIIIGAGGVGYWLSMALCRLYDEVIPIEVYDPDTFEGGSGFKRLPKAYNKSNFKVDLLKSQIAIIMGNKPPLVTKGYYLSETITSTTNLSNTLIVDCTDMNSIVRQTLWDETRKAGAVLIRVSYDGNGIVEVSGGLPFRKTGTSSSGYRIEPHIGHALLAAGLGASIVDAYIKTGQISEIQINLPKGDITL